MMLKIALALTVLLAAPSFAAGRSDMPRTAPDSVRIPDLRAPSFDDHKIDPGYRVGGVSLGMNAQQVLESLGPPLTPQPLSWVDGLSEYRWAHVSVFLRGSDQRVIEIRASDTAYSIRGGRDGLELSFNSTRRDVVNVFGRPDRIWHEYGDEYYWYKNGIAITFTKTDDTINKLNICANAGVCY